MQRQPFSKWQQQIGCRRERKQRGSNLYTTDLRARMIGDYRRRNDRAEVAVVELGVSYVALLALPTVHIICNLHQINAIL